MKKFEKLSSGKFQQFEISDAAKIVGGAQGASTGYYYPTKESATNESMVSNKDFCCTD
jgi:hypothetical protein